MMAAGLCCGQTHSANGARTAKHAQVVWSFIRSLHCFDALERRGSWHQSGDLFAALVKADRSVGVCAASFQPFGDSAGTTAVPPGRA